MLGGRRGYPRDVLESARTWNPRLFCQPSREHLCREGGGGWRLLCGPVRADQTGGGGTGQDSEPRGLRPRTPRVRELRTVGERAGRRAFSGGAGVLISSRESGIFGGKDVMMKRLLHLKRAGGKKEELTRITFPLLFSFEAYNTPVRWVLPFAFYR